MTKVAAATRLTAPESLPAWALIIRCVHQRGEDQIACIGELRRRGLWLGADQRIATGLTEAEFAAAYGPVPTIARQTDGPTFAVVRSTHGGRRRNSYRVVRLVEIDGQTYGRDIAETRWPDVYGSKQKAIAAGLNAAAAAGGKLRREMMERDFVPAAVEALRLV